MLAGELYSCSVMLRCLKHGLGSRLAEIVSNVEFPNLMSYLEVGFLASFSKAMNLTASKVRPSKELLRISLPMVI